MNLNDFDYPLPKELIAQTPVSPRDSSRLLLVDRASGEISDHSFSDILDFIPAGDVLVLNDTKVFPARLFAKKKKTGGGVDLLLLGPVGAPLVWRCLVQPALKEGQEVVLDGGKTEAVFLKRDFDGTPLVEFKGVADVRALAEKIGTVPLPPYIKREPAPADRESYQTVFANKEGAVAAPTAGLHFTPDLLERIRSKGVQTLFVTLHAGYGTFKPVQDLENHQLAAEEFELSPGVAEKINEAKSRKQGVWAVGTTAARALETCVRKRRLIPGKGQTDLYIKPPFEFEAVDHLLTNFHLPKTTLLLLVSAFMGEPLRKKTYDHAIREKYRFYSYGDAVVVI